MVAYLTNNLYLHTMWYRNYFAYNYVRLALLYIGFGYKIKLESSSTLSAVVHVAQIAYSQKETLDHFLGARKMPFKNLLKLLFSRLEMCAFME